jgi:hypothetical protein
MVWSVIARCDWRWLSLVVTASTIRFGRSGAVPTTSPRGRRADPWEYIDDADERRAIDSRSSARSSLGCIGSNRRP